MGTLPRTQALWNRSQLCSWQVQHSASLRVVSTLRAAKSKSFPKCYEELGELTLFKVDAFDFVKYRDDDV